MKLFTPPDVETRVSRRCPRCGGQGSVHGRVVRAIHDWETTFVECLRLRCCDATFLAAPPGLTPRARYSDRVVALVRALVTLGVPPRECVGLLAAARVPTTAQALRRWCADLPALRTPPSPIRARVTAAPGGDIAVRLGARAWLELEVADVDFAWSALAREMQASPSDRTPNSTARWQEGIQVIAGPRPGSPVP